METACLGTIYVCSNNNEEYPNGCSSRGKEYRNRLNAIVNERGLNNIIKIRVGVCSSNCKESHRRRSPTIYVDLSCVLEGRTPKMIHPGESGRIFTGVSYDCLGDLVSEIADYVRGMIDSPGLKNRTLQRYS